MEAKTAVLVALGVALALPYATVLLLRSGRFGLAAFAALFVAVCLLVVGSDLVGDENPPAGRE